MLYIIEMETIPMEKTEIDKIELEERDIIDCLKATVKDLNERTIKLKKQNEQLRKRLNAIVELCNEEEF